MAAGEGESARVRLGRARLARARERATRVRLFVALELPAFVRETLVEWCPVAGSPSWRVLDAAYVHVTLCFLGGQDPGAVAIVLSACRDAVEGFGAAGLRLGEELWLPRRDPRVLAVSVVDVDGTLGRVQGTLGSALAAGGWYTPERRPYLPHATVARVRRGSRVRPAAVAPPEPVSFIGESVTLFRSYLSSAGARYEALGTVVLGSPAGSSSG